MATQTEILAVKGTVKSYSTKKGFGFIDCKDERRDVFVYNTHLVGRVGLVPGEEVEFTLCFDGERPQARNVRVTHAAPQIPTATNAKDHPFEALTEAISRKSESPKPFEDTDAEHKSIRESALKAQAAQAVEVPTPPVVRKQTDIQEQIRSAQTHAMEERKSGIIQGNRPVTSSTEASADQERDEWNHWSQENWSQEKPKSKLPIGTEVSIANFPAQDLVGQKGVIKDYDSVTARYQVEVEVPNKPGSIEKSTSIFSFRVNQLRIEKIPIAPRKQEESTLSASAEPFNPMGSALEWAAVQGLNNLSGKGVDTDGPSLKDLFPKGKGMAGKGFFDDRKGMSKGDIDVFGMDPKGFALNAAKGEFLLRKGRDPFWMKGSKDAMMLAAKGGKDFLAATKGEYMKGEYMVAKGDLMVAKGRGSMDPVLAERGALMAKGGKDIMMAAAKGELVCKGIPDFMKGKGDPFGLIEPPFGKGTFMGKGDPLLMKDEQFLKGDPKGAFMGKGDPHLGKGELLSKGDPPGKPMMDLLSKVAKGSLLGKSDPFAAKGELLAAKGRAGADDAGKGSLSSEELAFFNSITDAKRTSGKAASGPEPRPDTRPSNVKPVQEGPKSTGDVQAERYNPSLAGNPGYAGAMWKVRKCADFQNVIIRKSKDVLSAETHRLRPDETCYQDGPMETLESGVVRMPIRPEGWVTVHARLLNGPTFLDLVSDETKSQVEPEYSRAEFLTVGKILGRQELPAGHLLASVRAMRMPELCRDHTAHTAKLERREARQAQKEKERERVVKEDDRTETETGKPSKGEVYGKGRTACNGKDKGASKGQEWTASGWKDWNNWGNQEWDGNWGKDSWAEWNPSPWEKPREESASETVPVQTLEEDSAEGVEQTPEKVEKEHAPDKTPIAKTEQSAPSIRKNCETQ